MKCACRLIPATFDLHQLLKRMKARRSVLAVAAQIICSLQRQESRFENRPCRCVQKNDLHQKGIQELRVLRLFLKKT